MEKSVTTKAPYFDAHEVARDLVGYIDAQNGVAHAARPAVLDRLKELLRSARAQAAQQLANDGNGRRCAEGLALFQDELIRLVFDYTIANVYRATNPSDAEHMAIVATGGYGRGLLAPFSDVDLLFLLALQADALGRERGRIHALPAVGLGPEGRPRHAHRRAIAQARAKRRHHSHRAARCPPDPGRQAALRGAEPSLPARGGERHGAPVRRGEDGRARPAPPPLRRVALSRRAQHQGRQGRPARPAHAALAGQVPLRRRPEHRLGRVQGVRGRRVRDLPPVRGLPLDHPLPSAFPDGPRRGAPDLRRAAGDGRAAGLCGPPGFACGRALHEALLSGGQGRGRPDHHPVLGAGDRAAQGLAGVHGVPQSAELAHAPPDSHQQRLSHRQRPAQRRRPGRVQARSGQSDPLLRQGRADGRLLPPQRRAAAAPVAAADRRQAAGTIPRPTASSWICCARRRTPSRRCGA